MFEYYEDIPLGFATIPTRLYRLEPIGIGTPLVESLTSYIQRLANAHAVSVSHLVKFEINPLLELGRLRPDNASVGARSKISAINGLGDTAQEWVAAVEALTLVSGLRNLTLLPFRHVFREKEVFNKPSSWCSKCFQEWTQNGEPIYWPLIWSMQPVKICPVHQIPLESNCPNCMGTSSAMRPISTPGQCPSCGRWYGFSGYQKDMPREIHYSVWAAKSVSDLIAAGPIMDSLSVVSLVPELLEYIMRTGVKRGGIRSFTRLVRISSNQLRVWLEGLQLPRLRELLYICCIFNLNLLDVISKKMNPDDKVQLVQVVMDRLDGAKSSTDSINWGGLSSLLRDVSSGKSSLMRIPDIAKFYNCSITTIYKRYPELCKEISAKVERKLAEERSIKKARTRAQIKVLVEECIENGVKPTRKLIFEALGQKPFSASQLIHQVYVEMGIRNSSILISKNL